MAQLPASINGVTIILAAGADSALSDKLLTALQSVISSDFEGVQLTELYVSSLSEPSGHSANSRHYPPGRNAIDLSRVYGKRMASSYGVDADLTRIVDALQDRFEALTDVRHENYGPSKCLRRGVARLDMVEMHRSHIHWSVK
jgi:hypothetical protein